MLELLTSLPHSASFSIICAVVGLLLRSVWDPHFSWGSLVNSHSYEKRSQKHMKVQKARNFETRMKTFTRTGAPAASLGI